MTKSDLATVVVPASSNNYSGRKGYKVCKFTPHHMAGNLSVEQCGKLFQNPSRGASSNYGIGTDGRIALYVDEAFRGWTSSNALNDRQAITVEVANNEIGGNWSISDAAWNSLVDLAEDICRRYGFRLEFDGTPNGSLTYHSMFANTACPGPYLKGKMEELARIVNERLDGKGPKPEPQPTPSEESYLVKVTANCLNIREKPTTNSAITGQIIDKGVYTIVETSSNWGRLKSGMGWICLDYTTDVNNTSVVHTSKKMKVTAKIGLNVRSTPGGAKVDALPFGTIVTVTEEQNGWSKIGENRWVSSQYLEKV